MFAITKERSSIMSEFVCIAAMYVASNRLAFEWWARNKPAKL